jgi:hypothetical protein
MGIQAEEERIQYDQSVEVSPRRKTIYASLWGGLPGYRYFRCSRRSRHHSRRAPNLSSYGERQSHRCQTISKHGLKPDVRNAVHSNRYRLPGISIQRLTNLYAQSHRQKDSTIPQRIDGPRDRIPGKEGLILKVFVDADWGASENLVCG